MHFKLQKYVEMGDLYMIFNFLHVLRTFFVEYCTIYAPNSLTEAARASVHLNQRSPITDTDFHDSAAILLYMNSLGTEAISSMLLGQFRRTH